MIKATSRIALVSITVALQACTVLSGQPTPSNAPQVRIGAVAPVTHTIVPGDRLGDISLKYTGRVKNWTDIATYNGITDPRSLKIGDVLTIPARLVQPGSTVLLETDEQLLVNDTENQQGLANVALYAQPTAANRTGKPSASTKQVVVSPVNANRTFELNPIDEDYPLNRAPTSSAPQVRVLGTYYPIAIYQQPASYANLMMRVTPGTILELDRTINDWYKVVTEEGIGYLRIGDGAIVNSN